MRWDILHVALSLEGVMGLMVVARTFADRLCQVSRPAISRYGIIRTTLFLSCTSSSKRRATVRGLDPSPTNSALIAVSLALPHFAAFKRQLVASNLVARRFFSTKRHSFQVDASSPEL